MTRKHPSRWLFRSAALAAAAALAALSLGCATNPVTGKNEFLITSQDREISTGEEHFATAREAAGGSLEVDPELTEYVNEVGGRISEVSDRPDLPYEFIVINSSQPHAWALPGGKIAVTRGLLVLLENEGQLASVLSHQIVHAAAKHRSKTLERNTMKTVAVATVAVGATMMGFPIFPVIGMVSSNEPTHHWLVHSPHSEDEELEADRYGMEYMRRAGYDPDHTVDALRILGQRESELTAEQEKRTLFVAHPLSRKRTSAARIVAYNHDQREGPEPPEPPDQYAEHMAWLRKMAPAYRAADASRNRLIEGDYANALILIQEARTVVPEEASFRETEGDILMMQSRYKEAFFAYDQAVRLRPDRFSGWLGRGMASKALGDPVNSRIDFEISYRLFPNRIAAKQLYPSRYPTKRYEAPKNAPAAETLADSTEDPNSPAFAEQHENPLADTTVMLPVDGLEDPDSPAFAARHESQLADTAPQRPVGDPARDETEPPSIGPENTP